MAKKEKAPTMKEVLKEVLEVLHESAHAPPADMDVDQLLQQMEGSLEELSERAEEIYKATGMSKKELEKFADNPENFSKEEWKMLGEIKKEIAGMQAEADKIFEKPGVAAVSKEARPKKRGGAKKKWMKS